MCRVKILEKSKVDMDMVATSILKLRPRLNVWVHQVHEDLVQREEHTKWSCVQHDLGINARREHNGGCMMEAEMAEAGRQRQDHCR